MFPEGNTVVRKLHRVFRLGRFSGVPATEKMLVERNFGVRGAFTRPAAESDLYLI